jgi:hypothetical protein
MNTPTNSGFSNPASVGSEADTQPLSGRYRFCAGRPLDPSEGLHPEIADTFQGLPLAAGIPNSPQELIAMQSNDNSADNAPDSKNNRAERPEKPERANSAKVNEVLELISKLETSGLEDQQIAISLLRGLESFHDGVVEELREDDTAKHDQIIAWSIDADRLMRSRMLLESIDLD